MIVKNLIIPMSITLVLVAAYVVLCTLFLKKADERRRLIPVRVVFFVLIALEVAKIFYLIGRDGSFYPNRFPIVFCSMSMYAYPVFCFKQNRFSDMAKGFSVLPGILAFLLFAAIQYKYNMSLMQVHSYIYHGSMLAVAVYLIASGSYRFKFKKFYPQSLLVGAYILTAAVLSLLIGGNISVFGPGDPYLSFLYDRAGFAVGICVLLLIQFAAHALVYGVVALCMRAAQNRRSRSHGDPANGGAKSALCSDGSTENAPEIERTAEAADDPAAAHEEA